MTTNIQENIEFNDDNICEAEMEMFTNTVKKFLGLETLKIQDSDNLNFHNISVTNLTRVLYEIYHEGYNSGYDDGYSDGYEYDDTIREI